MMAILLPFGFREDEYASVYDIITVLQRNIRYLTGATGLSESVFDLIISRMEQHAQMNLADLNLPPYYTVAFEALLVPVIEDCRYRGGLKVAIGNIAYLIAEACKIISRDEYSWCFSSQIAMSKLWQPQYLALNPTFVGNIRFVQIVLRYDQVQLQEMGVQLDQEVLNALAQRCALGTEHQSQGIVLF